MTTEERLEKKYHGLMVSGGFLVVLLIGASCGRKDAEGGKTPEEVYEKAKTAFAKGDGEAIANLLSPSNKEKWKEIWKNGKDSKLLNYFSKEEREKLSSEEALIKFCSKLSKEENSGAFDKKASVIEKHFYEDNCVFTIQIRGNQRSVDFTKEKDTWYWDMFGGAIRNARITNCSNNLSQLWKMQANYMVQYGGSHKLLPIETGSDFWLKLSSPETNLIDSSLSDIYFCPFSKVTRKSGKCSYRGPRSNVNKSKDGDPVGACIGVHPDGSANVLRKSGDVQTTNKGDSLFRSALEKTKP